MEIKKETQTIWTTKYLFTRGILKIKNAEISRHFDYVMAYHPEKSHEYYSSSNLHSSEEEANTQAKKQVNNRIKKLKQALEKLELMKFE